MPTYDYLCPNGHRFEVIHSVTADAPEVCAVCGASPVRKAFTAPTIHFKGTGWAKKDRSATSRSSSAASNASGSDASDASDASDTSSGSSTDGPSKKDAGADAKPAADKAKAKTSDDSPAKTGTPGAGTPRGSGSPAAD